MKSIELGWDGYLRLPRSQRQRALKRYMRDNGLALARGEAISKKFELIRIGRASLKKDLEKK